MMEYRVKPLREGNADLLARCEAFFSKCKSLS